MRLHSTERPWNCKRLLTTSRVLGFVGVVALAGCATTVPAPPPITPAEQVQRDQAAGTELARQFEAQLKFKQDKEVLVYLRNLAGALADATPELRSAAVGALVVSDRGGRWHDYAIPGNRLYLSSGLLKRVSFENELAAAMALQFGHVMKRHVFLRLQEQKLKATGPSDYPSLEGLVPSSGKAVDFFSPTGVYSFPDEYYLEAVEAAVEVLYKAGYDPRGLVSLWEIYETNPSHSPFEKDLLTKLLEKTRRVIALYSPLRNPIVRSQAFITIQRRMQRL
jgi:predicted Zn-dependent protease